MGQGACSLEPRDKPASAGQRLPATSPFLGSAVHDGSGRGPARSCRVAQNPRAVQCVQEPVKHRVHTMHIDAVE